MFRVIFLFFLGLVAFTAAAVTPPRIVVIGGGIGGMATVHYLAKAGVRAELFEGSARLGGRILTDKNGFGHKIRLDKGAALLDITHKYILNLARELRVPVVSRFKNGRPPMLYLLDSQVLHEPDFLNRIFRENGRALRRFAGDTHHLYNNDPNTSIVAGTQALSDFARELDSMSIEQYLKKTGFNDFAIRLFEAGVKSETGWSVKANSALVLFDTFAVDFKGQGLHFLPKNDESLIIQGGTQEVVDKLTDMYSNQVHLRHQLVEVDRRSDGRYVLSFAHRGQIVQEVVDEFVMAVPPPSLNSINWKIPRPPQLAVANIQYSGNTKLALLFKKKIWKDNPAIGMGPDGIGYQMWDVDVSDHSSMGVIMLYTEPLMERGYDIKAMIQHFLAQMETLYPGISSQYMGYQADEWVQSYSASDRPGDRTRLRLSMNSTGPIYWVNEAYSADSQGYINGAVQMAWFAARDIIAHGYLFPGPRCQGILAP